jgi:hypothetical protein
MQFEVEIATAEMERAQQRLMTLEREKEGLVAQVSDTLVTVTLSPTFCLAVLLKPGSSEAGQLLWRGGYKMACRVEKFTGDLGEGQPAKRRTDESAE